MKIVSLINCFMFVFAVHGAKAQPTTANDLVPADELEHYIVDEPRTCDDQEPPYECVAENAAGDSFTARGYRPSFVQRRALDKCFGVSRYCRPLGCHHVLYPRN